MKLRVYLDTTVVSAVEDVRAADRMQRTIEFFDRADEFELLASTLTRDELLQTPDEVRRAKLLKRLAEATILEITAEIQVLADDYVAEGIFPMVYRDDALHVAVAVLARANVVASWNFRHMVNRRRRSMVNFLNVSRGLPQIEIVTPAEL